MERVFAIFLPIAALVFAITCVFGLVTAVKGCMDGQLTWSMGTIFEFALHVGMSLFCGLASVQFAVMAWSLRGKKGVSSDAAAPQRPDAAELQKMVIGTVTWTCLQGANSWLTEVDGVDFVQAGDTGTLAGMEQLRTIIAQVHALEPDILKRINAHWRGKINVRSLQYGPDMTITRLGTGPDGQVVDFSLLYGPIDDWDDFGVVIGVKDGVVVYETWTG